MTGRSRIPLSQLRPGQVLRLDEPVDEIREGWFVYLGRDTGNFRVCRLGEDEEGELCETDEVHQVSGVDQPRAE